MRKGLIIGLVLALAGCSDPLAGVGRLSEVDVAATQTTSAALPTEEETAREGFFGTPAATGGAASEDSDTAPARAGGFLSGLFGGGVADKETDGSDKEVAALAPESLASGSGDRPRGSPRGASRAAKPRTGPDAREVAYGTLLPFGEIARVCDAKGRAMGKKIDQLGRRGPALYDTAPGLMSKRTYYLTGFADGCPRQFTAANALLGTPSTYEQFRFGPAGAHMPYAATDAAFDRLKSAACGARKSKPCGSKINRLDRTTAFISAYEFNEHNGRWKEFLIHDGNVLATALKALN